MNQIAIDSVGIAAGLLTTFSLYPQLMKILRTGNVRDVSLSMYVILSTGIFLWFVYGIFLGALPIIAANGLSFLLSGLILINKIIRER